ncbi:MAG: hydrogenase nickel incorporation protein HypB [Candidatus Aminicenantes bacterium]|nr:hydrogenase nickel incorporation protein HypB [Candidatus Aminicenantes bacterium]
MSRKEITILEDLLSSNKKIAQDIRLYLKAKNIFSINLMSSPGSGKTSLIEKLIEELFPKHPIAVIEGDIETDLDAARIKAKGVPAWSITTGGACHLEARMIAQVLKEISEPTEFLFIENVGNLVCPASYDLGENLRFVLLSIPEGEDKPLKYPKAFLTAHCLVITKIDLIGLLSFDLEKVKEEARKINPHLAIFATSARTGQGVKELATYLLYQRKQWLETNA